MFDTSRCLTCVYVSTSDMYNYCVQVYLNGPSCDMSSGVANLSLSGGVPSPAVPVLGNGSTVPLIFPAGSSVTPPALGAISGNFCFIDDFL